MTITHVLTDIEGTTTSIAFVTSVLFPDAAARLPGFIAERRADPAVQRHVAGLARSGGIAADDDDALAGLITAWIAADRKDGDLKALQGLVWDDGYRQGRFTAHVYPEVPALLRCWHDAGLDLAVYSSGSVHAQRMLFAHTAAGDLSALFSAHFDTTVGGKREAAAYVRICAALPVSDPGRVLFLSDVVAELDAAAAAGLQTHLLCRDQLITDAGHPVARDFAEVDRHWRLSDSVTADLRSGVA